MLQFSVQCFSDDSLDSENTDLSDSTPEDIADSEEQFYEGEDHDVTDDSNSVTQNLHDNSPIYAGRSVTVSMAVISIMSFVVRHKLTKRTIDDLQCPLNIFLGGTIALTRGYVYSFLQRVKYGYEITCTALTALHQLLKESLFVPLQDVTKI